MPLLDIFSLLITIAALFAYINHRWIGLPTTIGIMLIALLCSSALIVAAQLGWQTGVDMATQLLSHIDFNKTLMHALLSFLLFAGALHIELDSLLSRRWVIASLASVGVVTSAFIVATVCYFLFAALGYPLDYIYCLLFGALIAPTDPVAVLSILKASHAPKSLETKIAGESLFNDGVAVVLFLVVLGIATGEGEASASHVALLFAQEFFGGVLLGLLSGGLCYVLLRRIDHYQIEILLTLALVMGSYSLAPQLHVSGPIAVVVAGLLIGNRGRTLGMSPLTREHLNAFWELLDEVLNALLFLLIGLELLVLSLNAEILVLGLAVSVLVLLARAISVSIPVTLLRSRFSLHPNAITLLTWGGIRGGISIALALSLPPGDARDFILAITYIVVVTSILLQGTTMGRLVRYSEERLANNSENTSPKMQ